MSRLSSIVGAVPLQRDTGDLQIIDLVTRTRNAAAILRNNVLFFAAVGLITVSINSPAHATSYILISVGSLFVLGESLSGKSDRFPLLGMIMLQQWIVNAFPLIVENPANEVYSEDAFLGSSVAFFVFAVTAFIGKQTGLKLARTRPSQYRILPSLGVASFSRVGGAIAASLLCYAILFEVVLFTGYYWQFSGSAGVLLFPALRTSAIVAQMSGSFIGGFSVYQNPRWKVPFWVLWSTLFMLLVSSILLSSAISMVISLIVGIYFGARRIPWAVLFTVLAVIAFLNVGKFEMRAKYWQADGQSPVRRMSELPAYFSEWAVASAQKLGFADQSGLGQSEDRGQPFHERINTLQNLLFITQALNEQHLPSVAGAGYALLPAAVVPRFLWTNKPRTHEGQVLLNLHFGRQSDRESTERTYVAWGLLPEAMGNFGMWLGPVAIGLVMGLGCGVVEKWSKAKSVFSIEGLSVIILAVQLFLSFEMCAGVLLAALLQTEVVLIGACLIIRQFAIIGIAKKDKY
jgi:hypothetical protein